MADSKFYRFEDDNPLLPIMISSIISLVFTSYVIITILAFKKLRSHIINQIILNICTCSFFWNLSFFFGDSILACRMNSLFGIYFNMCLGWWVSTLMYFTYCMFSDMKVNVRPQLLNLLCWGFPLVALVIILLTCSKFSDYDHFCGLVAKTVNDDNKHPTKDQVALSLMIIFLIELEGFIQQMFNIFLFLRIFYKYYVLKLMNSALVWKIVSSCMLYVVTILSYYVCYIVLITKRSEVTRDDGGNVQFSPLEYYTLIANSLVGAVFGIIFIFTNVESRKRWKRLYNSAFKGKDYGGGGGVGLGGGSENSNPLYANQALRLSIIDEKSRASNLSDLEVYRTDSGDDDSVHFSSVGGSSKAMSRGKGGEESEEEDIDEDFDSVTNEVILAQGSDTLFLIGGGYGSNK